MGISASHSVPDPSAVHTSSPVTKHSPSPALQEWPFVGKPLYKLWYLASTNLEAALQQLGPEITAVGTWLLERAAGIGLGIVQFVVAVVIAGNRIYTGPLFIAQLISTGQNPAAAEIGKYPGNRQQLRECFGEV